MSSDISSKSCMDTVLQALGLRFLGKARPTPLPWSMYHDVAMTDPT